MKFVARLFRMKKRNEIRGGKLWEITRIWGFDVRTVERQPAKPQPVARHKAIDNVEAMRVHTLKNHDDVKNLTKNAELL
jgi:hypothetical protein